MITSISDLKKKFDNNDLVKSMSNNNILGPSAIRENINKNLGKIR